MKQFGFTLIELLWSIAIASILSSVGIAAFFTYSRTQALNAAVSEFTTMLQLAKFRAQSQVKPKGCSDSNYSLDGYRVDVNVLTGGYQLIAQCSGNDYPILNQNKLPQQMSFTCLSDASHPYFFFQVLTGAASSQSVQIEYNSNSVKRIWVSGVGVIQTEPGTACAT